MEDRRLLAVGPRLVGVLPNGDTLIEEGDVRNTAPTSLTFRFDENQVLDPGTIANGIRITRSGFDGSFGDPQDVLIQPGYIARADEPHEIIVRFAETLPDDHYRVEVIGAGLSPLRNIEGEPANDGQNVQLNFELDLGAQIIAVVPQPISRNPATQKLTQARREIEVYFNNDTLFVENDAGGQPTARSAEHPAFYQLIFTGDTVNNQDDVYFNPESVQYDAAANKATLVFADEFHRLIDPDTGSAVGAGTFRLRIGNTESKPLAPAQFDARVLGSSDFGTAGAAVVTFEADALAAERFGTAPTVVVDKADLGPGAPPAVALDGNVVLITLNSNAITPTTPLALRDAVKLDPVVGGFVTVTFTGDASANLAAAPTDYSPITLRGLGSSFDTASDLGVLGTQSQIISGAIDRQAFLLDFPGSPDEPGHARNPVEIGEHFDQHINPDFGADADFGVTTILYNFKADYGRSPAGEPLKNLITERQKQRAREALEVWGHFTGVQFLETATLGLTIVTGDPSALDPDDPNVMNHAIDNPEQDLDFIVRVDPEYSDSTLILDNARQWNDTFGSDWFITALRGIGAMLGLERASDLPPSTLMAFATSFVYDGAPTTPEPIFPGDHDITHGSYLHRPDSNDIDLYRFEIDVAGGRTGRFVAETFAERQANSSLLDPVLSVYREEPDGSRTLIAHNDDYFSKDAYIELELASGTYFVGVSSDGNEDYNANYQNAGFGGTSQGPYDLRLSFRPFLNEDNSIVDDNDGAPGLALDGDADGIPGGVYNFWFRGVDETDTIYVDKLTTPGLPIGTLTNPFDTIPVALAAARPGDVVRMVGNGGFDGDRSTLADNFAYEIGFGSLPGQVLNDGTTLAVPRGVTVMVDAGAIIKASQARIGVGSSSLGVDRSQGALQILGTSAESVYFTSFFDQQVGLDTHPPNTTPRPGDWGGVVFRNDLDNAEERFNYEDAGIFLNYVNHADMRYGGGTVVIDSIQQIVTPLQMTESRPTIAFNTIRRSADAAMSADPDSFEETNFHSPKFQLAGAFTSDYDRVGPEVHGNRLEANSANALFVRIATPAGGGLKPLTVAGRFDDTDIVHLIAENLQILGTPGESILETARPPIELVTLNALPGGTLPAGSYNYKLVFIDSNGFEGRPSKASVDVSLTPGAGRIRLNNLPPARGSFVARRLYRLDPTDGSYKFVAQLDASDTTFVDDGSSTGRTLQRDPPNVDAVTLSVAAGGTLAAGSYNYRVVFVDAKGTESPASDATVTLAVAGDPTEGSIQLDGLPTVNGVDFVARRVYRSSDDARAPYVLVAEMDASTTSLLDDGSDLGQTLNPVAFGVTRARTDARLAVDPGAIIKLEGARIESQFGAQFIAEGRDGQQIIFTSKLDDRFGAGGTFDTNNDGSRGGPTPGDWGGLFLGQLGEASIDYALLTYGGGINALEGTFKGFNIIEIHQADARITNSVIENNADGTGGQGPDDRFGRGPNMPATIMVRGAQPVLVNNVIQNNDAVAITINANSLNSRLVDDPGRSTGLLDLTGNFPGNQGPLVYGNRLGGNPLNGMQIRGDVLTVQSVWDDTDVVHVLIDDPTSDPVQDGLIIVPNFHTNVGLRLESSAERSLVVKMDGPGDNFNTSMGAGFTAAGRQTANEHRIGGAVHVVGQPDFPVILTSLADDQVGAGLTPDDEPLVDTNADGSTSVPKPGDWRSIRLEQFSNDRNVELIMESESPGAVAPGENAIPDTAQFIGDLAPFQLGGDDNLRLGFEVIGQLNERNDIDVYSFNATAGTEVWLDIDRTTSTLDTVVELIDTNGTIIALSDNSVEETLDPSKLLSNPGAIARSAVNPLQRLAPEYQPRHASGLTKDFFSTNVLDAGMRIVLPGVAGTRSSYHVRVRSSSDDLANIDGGLTTGSYKMQVRLGERDEIPGSTVRYADIRYSTNGVELSGVPYHSPLTGEVGEDEVTGGPEHNDQIPPNPFIPGVGPQDIGNLLDTDRATLSIAGTISELDDLDFYEMQINYDDSVNGLYQHAPVIFDLDMADGLSRPNSILTLFDEFGRPLMIGYDSNVADDRSGPQDEGSLSDLSRGSVGALDPFLGPVELPEGTYFVGVSSNDRIPQELIVNPNVRLEPVNSIRRIAEDRIGNSSRSVAEDPVVPVLFDFDSVIPEAAEDITLFMLQDIAGVDTLIAVDPLTGQVVNQIGVIGSTIGDFATRLNDGTLSAFSLGTDDASAGLFLDINSRDASIESSNDDLIETYQEHPTIPGLAVPSDVGINFNAMTFMWMNDADGNPVQRLFAVGERGDIDTPPPGPTPLPDYFDNILYNFDPMTGVATSDPEADKAGNARATGAGTQIVERGHLDTFAGGGPGGNITGLAVLDDDGPSGADGQLYAVSDAGVLYKVHDPLTASASLELVFDFGADNPEVEPNDVAADAMNLDDLHWTLRPSPNVGDAAGNDTSTTVPHVVVLGTAEPGGPVDLYSFTVANGGLATFDIDFGVNDTDPTDPGNVDLSLLLFDDTGALLATNDDSASLLSGAGGSNSLADPFLALALAPGEYFLGVAGPGGSPFDLDGGDYTLQVSVENNPYSFTGLTSRHRFRDAADPFLGNLFATDSGGTVYVMDDAAAPVPFFPGGESKYATGVDGAQGLAFSSINLWHVTERRADDFGHGIGELFDDSRGNSSKLQEIEPNNTLATGQDLEEYFWSTGYDVNIGDAAGNTSTEIPHITVRGSGDNTYDYYKFDVVIPPDDPDGLVRGIFDIDVDYDELLDPSGVMDAELYLFDELGTLLAFNLDAPPTVGAQGSQQIFDPYLEFNFDTNGTYAILVARTIPPIQQPPQDGDFYDLHVSLEEHRNDGVDLDDGLSLYFGHERGNPDEYTRAFGELVSNEFSLKGYAAEDKPVLYFTYLLDVDKVADDPQAMDNVEVYLVEADGTENLLAARDAGLTNDITWRQVRVELDDFAGQEGLRVKFVFDTVNDVLNRIEGIYLDDFIIGFAERGEMITFADNNPIFSINPNQPGNEVLTGEYQLEIRRGADFGVSQDPQPRTLELHTAFDTNDRLVQQATLIAPAGAGITDQQTFTLGDGNNTLTFEFDSGGGIGEGNVRVPFSPLDPAEIVAARIRDAINSTSVQTILKLQASLSNGVATGLGSSSNLVNLFGNAIVDDTEIGVIRHDQTGDRNLFRDQGQVLIHSNFITSVRDFGIVADAGSRDVEDRVPTGFLEAHPGTVRQLRELNNLPSGGLIPGATIENNVITGEGLGGIHVSGNLQPYEMTTFRPAAFPDQFQNGATAGDQVCDGQQFTVHMYRTTVTFEFEDIGGGGINPPCGLSVTGQRGSGKQAGDGWTPGTIPVFYRRSGSGYLNRQLGYTQEEMATAIRDAIQGSILVTNGTTLVGEAHVFGSRSIGDPDVGPDPAVFVEHASAVEGPLFNDVPCEEQLVCGFIGRRVAIQEAPQPYARVINNTVFGNDGDLGFYPGTATDEPNDTLQDAVETRQGRSHNNEAFTDRATIGDTSDFADQSLDVDFYKVHLDAGDRVEVDTAALNILVNDPTADPPLSNYSQSENSLAIWDDGQTIMVGFNDSGSAVNNQNKFTGYAISRDGGRSFVDQGELPFDTEGDAGDPVIARDNETGTLYFSTLSAVLGPIQVWRSFDDGQTWELPTNGTPGTAGFQDKEWMTVDNFAGPGQGNVYLAARDFGPGDGIYFFRSTDEGSTFSPAGGVQIAPGGQGAWVVVTPNHNVHVFHYDNIAGPTIQVRTSVDEGQTFGAAVVAATLNSLGVNGDLGLTRSNQSPDTFRSNTFPQVVANPVNGHLYMTFADDPVGGDKADVFFTMSTDDGLSWTPPQRVNDDGTSNDQWQPSIAVTPNGEKVGIFWYDRRLSPGNETIDYFGRVGEVNGATVDFSAPDFRISKESFLPVFGVDAPLNPTYMGDYDQAQATNDAFYVVWADNRLGTPDVRFAKIAARGLEPALRLFDDQGNELQADSSPQPTLDFTADRSGNYFVGISGVGNESYDPQGLGNRLSTDAVGEYDIEINVHAPRTWVIEALDGSLVIDGTTFQVSDTQTTVIYEFDDVRFPGVQPGHIPISYDGSPIPNGNQRGPGYRPPEMAVAIANVLGQGLEGVTATALGGRFGASGPLPPQTPVIFPDTVPFGFPGFSHDVQFTTEEASTELYVVVQGAANIVGGVNFMPQLNENVDQVLAETGILASERSSPTVLNNVLSNLESGIIQDASPTTVVGASIFQHNHATDTNVGAAGQDFNIILNPFEPLFADPAVNFFYPAPLSRTIDSALDSLEDREDFKRVKSAVGIPPSPVLSPERDAQGLLRADDPDVSTPSGIGANVFKDRGALDRADFIGPDAVLIDPRDNDSEGIDLDSTLTVVQLSEGVYTNFSIQLVDGLEGGNGVGVNDRSITSEKVSLTEDGQLLTEGEDYTFGYNPVTNVIRLNPLSGIWPNDKTYVIRLNNTDRFIVTPPDGGQVVDGDTFFILDQNSATVTFEYESGYSLFVPETLSMQVPAAGYAPGAIQDGQRFVISDGAGNFTTFEFDRNSPPNILPRNIRVDVTTANTQEEVALAIISAINGAGVSMQARYLGDGKIHLGAPSTFTVDVSLSRLTQSGELGVVIDGQTMEIRDGANPPVIFEFDDNGRFIDADGDGQPDNVLITFSQDSTQDDIAQAITDAVAGVASLGLTPSNFGEGHVHIGGQVGQVLNTTAVPRLTVQGEPGVSSSTRIQIPVIGVAPGGIEDGQTFTINDGQGNTDTFEFDKDGRTTDGNRLILFTDSTTNDQLANSIVSAITISSVGLLPVNLGSGEILLNDTAQHTTDVTASALTKSGVPGGAVPVPFLPDATYTSEDMTPVVLDIIRNSDLTDVEITLRGGTTYFFDGAKAISGLPNTFLSAIEDLPGNNLRPNQPTNVTQFTILMPGVELDFGDAPRAGDLGGGFPTKSYPTLFADNGARHVVPTSDALSFGATVDPDADGQPDAGAAGDTDDGIIIGSLFNRHIDTPITVNVSGAGFLDGWIDYNRDGDWTDPGEQVFVSVPVFAGDNEFTLRAPALAEFGQTAARFRLSREGGLTPVGIAPDGEVEDYLIEVVDGTPPVAVDDPTVVPDPDYTTTEDEVLDVVAPGVLANDSDPDGDPIFAIPQTGVLSTLGALVTLRADGSFTYDPTGSQTLQSLSPDDPPVIDTFTYQATDGLLPSNVATVSISVTGVNDAPEAVDDPSVAGDPAFATDEDTPITLTAPGAMANDFDVDGDTITVDVNNVNTQTTSTRGATITWNADGSFTYDPTSSIELQELTASDPAVADTFTYAITDGTETDTATVTILVNGANDAPIGVDDNYNTNEDEVLTVDPRGVLANDRDDDRGETSGLFVVNTGNLTSDKGVPVVLNADGSFSYDPTNVALMQALPLNGTPATDSFTYTVSDGNPGGESTATVRITVEGRNDDPVADDDTGYATDQDEVLFVSASLGVLRDTAADGEGDTDVDTGDTISVDVANSDAVSARGAVVVLQSNGSFSYDPTNSDELKALKPTDPPVTDTFTYTVIDNQGGTDTATVSVVVSGVNVPPEAVDDPDTAGDPDYRTDEDTPLTVAAPGVLANDSDPDGDPSNPPTLDAGPRTSTFGADVVLNADGSFSYDPTVSSTLQALNVGAPVTDTFTYTLRDAQGATDTATVTITVDGVNDGPLAADDIEIVPRNITTNLDVTDNDTDIDGVLNLGSLTIEMPASNGNAVARTDGTVDYTPNANFSGTDTFTYTIRDNSGAISREATVTVFVNDPPIAANDDDVEVIRNTATPIDVLANDTDAEGAFDLDSVRIIQPPVNGTAIPNANGTVTYTPNQDYVGPDSFTYTVDDNLGQTSNEALVSIDVKLDPFPHQNPINKLDVNADGFVSPIDALLVINDLNFFGARELPNPPEPPLIPPPFLDTNGDGQVTPADALAVINFLNSIGGGQAEGEVGLQGLGSDAWAGDLASWFSNQYTVDTLSVVHGPLAATTAETAADAILAEIGFDSRAQLSLDDAVDLLAEDLSDGDQDLLDDTWADWDA